VLAKVHRLVRADDYRQTVRRGRKVAATNTISYVIDRGDGNPVRFGFIVSKAVGNAVTRNRVRRRLKAASYEVLARTRPGLDIVVRALPASDRASWVTLRNEIFGLVDRLEVSR
jgi:ribonuclease P protein component